jgi:flagellar assembly protein FliH
VGTVKIIRNDEASALQTHGGLAELNFAQIEAQADAILVQAREQADEVLCQARADAEQLRKEALERARQEGLQAGLEEGRQQGLHEAHERFDREHLSLVRALQATMQQLDQAKQQWLEESLDDLLALAVAVAQRVVVRVGQFDRDQVKQTLVKAAELVGSQRDLLIRVHPDDLATAERFACDWEAAQATASHVKVLADEGVTPGGAVIGFGECIIDAQLETQIERIAAELAPARFQAAAADSAPAGEESS